MGENVLLCGYKKGDEGLSPLSSDTDILTISNFNIKSYPQFRCGASFSSQTNYPQWYVNKLFGLRFYYGVLYLWDMENFIYIIQELSKERVCVEVMDEGKTFGLLYFEKPKKSWVRKPVMSSRWGLVDAKIEGEYKDTTPKELTSYCQELLHKAGY